MARLLVLNFFPAFNPASSGGELRVGTLYRALAKTNDVTLLTSTDFGARFEEVQHQAGFREIRFPKDKLWRRAYATLEGSGLTGELSGVAFALAVSDPSCRLRQKALELAKDADYIIHEFPYSEPIFSAGAAVPEIYNAHNFEISLLASIVQGPGFDALFLKLMRMEGNLVARARLVFAASPVDGDMFRLFYGIDPGRIALCPNGFDDAELKDVAEARKRVKSVHARPKLLFMASHHAPNVDAAMFLIELAGELPKCDVILAGGVCQLLGDRDMPANVIRVGAFDAAAKAQLLLDADLFLNPVTVGSGTSLKALEALGAGVPMVATPEGVRGLGLRHQADVILAPREGFAAAIRKLLAGRAQVRKMAAAGRVVALRDFTWSQIAVRFVAQLAAATSVPQGGSPMFLALNDYPVHLSNSGGVARIRKLLGQYPADTVLVTFGPRYEFVLISPMLLAVTVPKSDIHLRYEREVNRGEMNTANDVVASLFASSNRVLVAITLGLARRARAVVFEHPFMAPLLAAIRRLRADVPVIYNAHNVEALHKAELLRGHKAGAVLTDLAAGLEAYLVEIADLILCCTAADAGSLAGSKGAVMVVPNGCEAADPAVLEAARKAGGEGAPRIGFLGSAHGPNIAALAYIVQEIAPKFPELAFEVIGEVCSNIAMPAGRHVKLHGMVDEAAKSGIMANWSLALNPVLSGGGSSLKLADYMAHGLVTINTPAGARGFDVVANDAGYVAALDEFDALIGAVLADPERARKGANAYRYAAERLSWAVCMQEYRGYLTGLLSEGFADGAAGQALLVVTDQYAEPAAAEAQVYLVEVLRQLRPRFRRIDLAAIDAMRLTRERHFATRAEGTGEGAAGRVGELFDQAFYFAPDGPRDDVRVRCRALEGQWTRAEPELFAPFAHLWGALDEPLLFGGFYPPEIVGGALRRWSAPEFGLLIPAGSRILRLRGTGPFEKTLRVTIAQIAPSGVFQELAQIAQPVSNSFSVSFGLPAVSGRQPVVVLCQVEPHEAGGDHRPFGVLLDDASVLQDRGPAPRAGDAQLRALEEMPADLTRDIETELWGRAFQPWMTRLRDAALRQSAAMGADFAAVHKVQSAAMRRWLPAAIETYDVVLVQGHQFEALAQIRDALAGVERRPLVMALPHFQGADRMAFWRHDLESLAAGQMNLLFSRDVADVLELGERAAIVPAGGVHAGDALDPAALSRFQDIYSSRAPFFLVIGQQPVERVVWAVRELRREGIEVGLVAIGVEGDGGAAGGETVQFLGEQPRDIIHGAVSACLGVIDLSPTAFFSAGVCMAWLGRKPVIANRNCAAFREMIRHRDNGFLVGADWELLAAMRELATDPAECGRIGAAGFAEVHARFTWPAVARAVMEVLEGGKSEDRSRELVAVRQLDKSGAA